MDKGKRKGLQSAYKNRTVTGGIYYVKCSGNQRIWIRSTTDIEGTRNKVMFSLKMKGPPEPAMLRECSEYGWESFSFGVLEELKKKEAQTDKEFADNIATLLEIWLEKYERGEIDLKE
ncbi:MAG: GIY-YIG nuclease family protein [Synergistaceae bacterium]|nr:GIY-YIG nuclease family protein [Synergistaceae bacterium]